MVVTAKTTAGGWYLWPPLACHVGAHHFRSAFAPFCVPAAFTRCGEPYPIPTPTPISVDTSTPVYAPSLTHTPTPTPTSVVPGPASTRQGVREEQDKYVLSVKLGAHSLTAEPLPGTALTPPATITLTPVPNPYVSLGQNRGSK